MATHYLIFTLVSSPRCTVVSNIENAMIFKYKIDLRCNAIFPFKVFCIFYLLFLKDFLNWELMKKLSSWNLRKKYHLIETRKRCYKMLWISSVK